MASSSLFPLPLQKPALDQTRRRGPPSALILGAAYQKKVLRTHKKFIEPGPPVDCCRLIKSNGSEALVRSGFNRVLSGLANGRKGAQRGSFVLFDKPATVTNRTGSDTTSIDHNTFRSSANDYRPDRTVISCNSVLTSSPRRSSDSVHSFTESKPIAFPELCYLEQSNSTVSV